MAISSHANLPILGRLPPHWRAVEFGSILDGGTRNGVYKTKQFHGTGDKVVNMGELFAYPRLFAVPMKRVKLTEEERARSALQVGDLLFARRSLVAEGAGKCSIVCEINEPTTFESSIIRARPETSRADSKYLYYVFLSPYGAYILDTIRRQVAVSGITGTDLVKLLIPLPPLREQQALAHILGTLDDKIELNRRMNETLEAMARALFKSWFVDFDPVRAKAEKRQPAGMDAETAALFPSSFEESPLGQIPKGWRANTLAEIVEINSWTLNKSDELERVEYIEISEVMRGDVLNVQEFIRGQEPSRARRRLRHGDTIISTVRPDRGAYFLCLNPSLHLIASTGFAVLTPIKAPWSFVYSAATQPEIFPYLGRLADGGAYPAISPEAICKWEIAVPYESQILAKYQELCAPLFEFSVANRVNSRTLAALRDALLPKLLSGEIRVCQAESLIAEAV